MSLSVLIQNTLQPLTYPELALVAISGLLLVAAGPFKYYANPLFPVKLALLVAALGTHTWLTRRLARSNGASSSMRALALTSLLLWTGVVVARQEPRELPAPQRLFSAVEQLEL